MKWALAIILAISSVMPKQTAKEAAELVRPDPLRVPQVDAFGSLIAPGIPDVVAAVNATGGLMVVVMHDDGWAGEDKAIEQCGKSVAATYKAHPKEAFTVECFPSAKLYWTLNPQ